MTDSSQDQRLVNELLDIESQIHHAPAHAAGGPWDVTPELLRLAVREAELLDRMRPEGRSRSPQQAEE